MSVPRFSAEEAQAIKVYRERILPGRAEWRGHLSYVLPSLLFAIVGFLKADYIALLVAYLALLGYGIYVLRRSHAWAKHLPSILKKYADSYAKPGTRR